MATPVTFAYSEPEWQEAAGHRPLQNLGTEDLVLLHRHWMWSNQIREALDQSLSSGADDERGPAMLAARDFGFMFVWYAMLWAVIEACIDPKEGRNVEMRGKLLEDISELADPLRRFRDAVLHVPRTGTYVDPRLTALVSHPASATTLRRIHAGFGRMFLEELAVRG